jgi:hypothetical protein
MTQCTYIGDGTGCTATALAGKSYCLDHYALVYQKGTARARRHKEIQTVSKVRLVESLFNEAVSELEAEGFDVYGDSERLEA